MKHLTKKIKGKQYARPFFIKDGYFWAIQNAINKIKSYINGEYKIIDQASDMSLVSENEMELNKKLIYDCFKIPTHLRPNDEK